MKTISLKKVSAVAVASLGFGLLSVVPAQATAVAANELTMTGTASSNANILAGTAGTVIITEGSTSAGAAAAFKLTSPGGTVSYVGTHYANATVGVAAAVATKSSTLTLATTFLTSPGKWTVSAAMGATSEMDDLAEVTSTTAAATIVTEEFFVYAASATFVGGLGRTVTAANNIVQDVNGQITYFVVADTDSASYTVSVTGATIVSAWASNAGYTSATALTASSTDTVVASNGVNFSNGALWTPTVKKGVLQVKITSPAAGTSTITVAPLSASGIPGTAVTATGTWGAAPVIGTTGSSSTSLIDASVATPFAGAAADVAISAPLTANTRQATIKVKLMDTQATPVLIAAKAVTATVTGPGLVGGSVGTGTDNAYTNSTVSGTVGRAITANTDALGNVYFGVYGDGTSGVSTITITQGTTVVGIEKVTFYGAVASFTATAKKNIANSGSATTGAVDVVAYDANKVVVPSVGLTITSGTTATIGSFNETSSSASEAAAGTAVVDVTGVSTKFGSVVLTIKDTATGLISTTVTVKVGALEAATVTAAFDKTSYTPGELVTLTLTALDADGASVADGTTASSLAITTNMAVQGTLPTAATWALGKQAITFYAPAVSTPLTVSIALTSGAAWSTALDGTTITASSKVVAADAALMTMIDALNAKIVALNALIAKIMKKLGVK